MTTLYRMKEGDHDPRHGTNNGYCNLRCRCQLCRDAFAAYHRAYRLRNRLAPDDPRHGTVNGYVNHRCRCPGCRAAQARGRRSHHREGAR